MPERQSGLGPLGVQAIQRASAEWANRGPRISESMATEATENPSALTAEQPGEAAGPPGDWLPFDSSRVSEASYDSQNNRLFVRFVKPFPGADEYVYEGVPLNIWHNFRRSSSPGRYINRVLNEFDYHRAR